MLNYQISFSIDSVLLFALFLTSTTGFSALGYFINEYFDIKHDIASGKPNRLARLNLSQLFFILILLLLLALLPWLFLPKNIFTILLLTLEIILFLIYSMPFPRLKEVWYLSGIIDSLYAYVIPFFISYHTFTLFAAGITSFGSNIFFFAFAVGLLGYRNIVQHQLSDLKNDIKSGIITLPQKIKGKGMVTLLSICLIVETLLLLIYFVVIAQKESLFHLLIFLFVIYTILNVLLKAKAYKSAGKFTMLYSNNHFYQVYFPLVCLVMLIFRNPMWLILLAFHLVFFVPAYIYELYKVFPRIRFITSLIVNYSIYYFFLAFGINLKKENISAIEFLRKKYKAQSRK